MVTSMGEGRLGWPLVGVDCPWFGSDLGGWLVGRRAVMDGSEAVWLAGLAAFDREGGWAVDGALSCAGWLMGRAGMARATAFERVRVARELDRRPVLAAALAEGRVSYCAVRVMVRAVGASTGVDRALVAVAETGSVADVEVAVRAYRLHDEQDRKPGERAVRRGVRVRRLGEGMVRVEAVLTEVEGAELEAVLRAMLDRDIPTPTDPAGDGERADESTRADCPAGPAGGGSPVDSGPVHSGPVDGGPVDGGPVDGGPAAESARADCPGDPAGAGESAGGSARADSSIPGGTHAGDRPSWPEMRADALMVAVRAALGSLPAPGADRYTVHLVVRHDHGCLLGGDPLASAEWQRIACDCGTVTHHHDPGGRPLTLGRRQRTWSTAQRRAVTIRDNGRCRWPACPNTHVDIHHLRPWSQGGTTDVSNGILLCPGHHTRIHQGFKTHGHPDTTLAFTRPDGTPIGTSTTRPAIPHLPLAA
jgi:hypothetical protein